MMSMRMMSTFPTSRLGSRVGGSARRVGSASPTIRRKVLIMLILLILLILLIRLSASGGHPRRHHHHSAGLPALSHF